MGKTSIEWCDNVWNPVRGCSRVSEGCRNCYAEKIAGRFSGPGQAYEGLAERRLRVLGEEDGRIVARWTGEVVAIADQLTTPLTWASPKRVFVNSMSDLFHEKLTNEEIAAVFGVMAAAPRHTFQVLTKRAERMYDWFGWIAGFRGEDWEHRPSFCWGLAKDAIRTTGAAIDSSTWDADFVRVAHMIAWPLPNVWLGVSAENQDAADDRIPWLLETPAARRFVSAEPLLGAIDASSYMDPAGAPCGETSAVIDWLIAGCESGVGARPCQLEWLRRLRDQCEHSGTRFFLKQAMELGAHEVPGGMRVGDTNPIAFDRGSKRSGKKLIKLPYLDGEQFAEFPS